jgi:hypothetical protein
MNNCFGLAGLGLFKGRSLLRIPASSPWRFADRMRLAVMGDVRGRYGYTGSYWELGSFVSELGQHFLVTKIRSFLEHQIVFFEKSRFNHQNDQSGILVFILDPEAVFEVFRLRNYTNISEL